jgi:hypothetical protein
VYIPYVLGGAVVYWQDIPHAKLRDLCGITKYNVLMPFVLMVPIQEKIINLKITTLL